MGQQHKADDYAPHHVAHHYLQESQIADVSDPRNADNGQRAGLGRDDRQRNGPPRYIAIRQKVIAQRALALAKAQAEQRDARQVKRDDRQVDLVQSHGCVCGLCRQGRRVRE